MINRIKDITNKIKYKLFYCSMEAYYVFETDLNETIFDINNIKIEKKGNNEDDIRNLISFWPKYFKFDKTDEDLRKDLKSFYKNGDECFCIMSDDKIVSMTWVGYQESDILKTFAKKIGLQNDEAILHRAYVSKEYRGRNIYANSILFIHKYLKEKGFKKCYTYVGIANSASIYINTNICNRMHILYHVSLKVFNINFNIFPKYCRDINSQ